MTWASGYQRGISIDFDKIMFSMMHFDGKIEMSFLNVISYIIGTKALCLQVITYIPTYLTM